MSIHFEKVTKKHLDTIFNWIVQDFVAEFWDNTQAHKDDIVNFVEGRKTPSNYPDGKYVYWLAFFNNEPFAMLMTIQETQQDDIGQEKLSRLSKTGNTYGIDYMIGNPKFFGKGYGAKTLIEFMDYFRKNVDPKADTFLIDPASDNPKAKHVYMKAGFQHVADFVMQGNHSGAGKLHHLLIRKFESENFVIPTVALAQKLILAQFPEYADLSVSEVEKQGHDNRTFRLGDNMLIRMPTAEAYALKVPKEKALLPKLAKHLSIKIPVPIKMGKPSADYPYPFSIYKWLPGTSINLLALTEREKEQLAFDLANFLKELQAIKDVDGPSPGQHNWWRGDHVSVYNSGAREQIAKLESIIDSDKALNLWDRACVTQWNNLPVWVHGDFAIGNMLVKNGKLSAIIDFGGIALGDPACDLVITWTYLTREARDIFVNKMDLDADTWLRARAWALWKATFELCQIDNKNSSAADLQKNIINAVIDVGS